MYNYSNSLYDCVLYKRQQERDKRKQEKEAKKLNEKEKNLLDAIKVFYLIFFRH